MTDIPTDALAQRTRSGWSRVATVAVGVLGAVLTAIVIAYLVAEGHPEIALALLVAVPVASIVLHNPLAAIVIWLVITPFLVATDGGAIRMVYWLVHRTLPVVALANLIIGSALQVSKRRLPPVDWPELAMAGYLVVTVFSILFTGEDVAAATIHLYDRVFIPMCLYMLVRFVEPDEAALRRVLPIAIYLLLSQTLFGVLSWVAPQVLPSAWQGRLGLRTIGSLSHPNIYGTTLLAVGLLVLHTGMSSRDSAVRRRLLLLFPLAFVMVFMTYSRASWLAGMVVVLGLFAIYPRYITKLSLVSIMVGMALLASGRINEQVEMAQNRFRSEGSEESALSRLPVMAASVRMFQAKPLLGWGYENFDRYDRQFQSAVGGLVAPEKDHASHNLYLTLLSEQGLIGFLLYMGPAFCWLVRSRTTWRTMPAEGFFSRQLLVCLWLILAAQVVVNNYSNMRVVYGLGIWWLTLGMIATLAVRHHPLVFAESATQDRSAHVAAASATRNDLESGDFP
jgi:O-antigen ligase